MSDVPAEVFVQVVDIRDRRQISWGSTGIERLRDRLGDLKIAIEAGMHSVAGSLDAMSGAKVGWDLHEVTASFGVTLAAESSVIVSRASAAASIEVTVTYRRAGLNES